MNETKLIILNGIARSGKDTFAELFTKEAEKQNFAVVTYSTIDKIKQIAVENFGWNGIKDEKGRKLLSDLKIASINYNDMPTVDMINEYKLAQENNVDFLLVMLRDIPEIEKAVAHPELDVLTVFINRPVASKTWNNVADDSVADYIYDIYIDNSGDLEQLKDAAKNLLFYLTFTEDEAQG